VLVVERFVAWMPRRLRRSLGHKLLPMVTMALER
jgi:hypothetical protein